MTTTAAEPTCPKCGGLMWNNIATKKNPKAPDYKCRTATCDGVVWPPKGPQKQPANWGAPTAPAVSTPTARQPYSAGPALPYEEAAAGFSGDAMPFEKLDHLFRVYSLIEDHVLATSVPKFTKADVGTTPESVAAQIHTLYIDARKAGV